MNTEFWYKRGETVRLGATEGLYTITKTMSRADGKAFSHYYQLIGAVTSKPILTAEGNVWHLEKSLRKHHSESYMSFSELMESLKNIVDEQDFK